MVFCISRTKSLKSLVPGDCGCSREAAVALPGCFLRFPMLHKGEAQAAHRPRHVTQAVGPGSHRRPAPGPCPKAAVPRCPCGACFPDGLVLLVAELQGPLASEVVGKRVELSPGPAV